jgi:hypothetical protein
MEPELPQTGIGQRCRRVRDDSGCDVRLEERTMTTARWITVALLTPFWWGMGLLVLAFVADLVPLRRRQVFALFGRLEHAPGDRSTNVRDRMAA